MPMLHYAAFHNPASDVQFETASESCCAVLDSRMATQNAASLFHVVDHGCTLGTLISYAI